MVVIEDAEDLEGNKVHWLRVNPNSISYFYETSDKTVVAITCGQHSFIVTTKLSANIIASRIAYD